MNRYPFKQQPLPWLRSSVNKFLSEQSIQLHYDQLHKGYVDRLNQLAEDYSDLEDLDITEITLRYIGPIKHNAAQILNHDFFWNSISPDTNKPSNRLYALIEAQFGSYNNFVNEFTQRSLNLFGSGWVWLIFDGSMLLVVDGGDDYTPLSDGYTPLLCLDIWEHSYIIDYQSDRRKYIETFWQYANWNNVEKIAQEYIFNIN